MKITFGKDEPEYIYNDDKKEGETAAKISELLDGFTLEKAERILRRVRNNYGNAIYRKDFCD